MCLQRSVVLEISGTPFCLHLLDGRGVLFLRWSVPEESWHLSLWAPLLLAVSVFIIVIVSWTSGSFSSHYFSILDWSCLSHFSLLTSAITARISCHKLFPFDHSWRWGFWWEHPVAVMSSPTSSFHVLRVFPNFFLSWPQQVLNLISSPGIDHVVSLTFHWLFLCPAGHCWLFIFFFIFISMKSVLWGLPHYVPFTLTSMCIFWHYNLITYHTVKTVLNVIG